MEHLNIKESVLNCPICRHLSDKKYLWNQYITPVSVTPNISNENFIKKKKMTYKKINEQKSNKLLIANVIDTNKSNHNMKTKRHKHHKKKPSFMYQVYTLTTNNNEDKTKKTIRPKKSRTVYSYPYSSSSSDSSLVEDSDSEEYNTCRKFPITEKHYRHIVDGVECSSHHNKPSVSKKKPKVEKRKVTKRADIDFNQIHLKKSNASTQSKTKKKCNCKSKCKPDLHNDDGSDSELSEKTFGKFINSLHSYVSKTKKMNSKQHNIVSKQKKSSENDSSCTLCCKQDRCQKKKSIKEHDATKHHYHQPSRHKTEAHEILKKYLYK